MTKYVAFLILLCFFSCQSPASPQPTAFSQVAMTIPYRLLIGDPLNSEQKTLVQQIIDQTFEEIHQRYNKWNPDSELSQINQLPAGKRFQPSPDLYQFLQRVGTFVELSGGRFDPTIEPLQSLWKRYLDEGRLPPQEEIDQLRPCLGWRTLHLMDGYIYKDDSHTQIDLGGIAKGLCVDLLIERLHQAGFQHLYVEWGGEIRTRGQHPSHRPWHVYISRLEDHDPAHAIAYLSLSNQALATSGDYFQHWTIQTSQGPITYCHIFNPQTLYPLEVKSGSVASASLLADDCVTADAWAKVLMLFDSVEEASAWIESLQPHFPHLAYWIVTRP